MPAEEGAASTGSALLPTCPGVTFGWDRLCRGSGGELGPSMALPAQHIPGAAVGSQPWLRVES